MTADPTGHANPPDQPATPERRRFRFSPRQSERRLNRRYTRLVAWAKVVLPTAALGLIALVILWPTLRDEIAPLDVEVQRGEDGAVQMTNPRYFGTTSNDLPFSVSGVSAVQSDAEDGVVVLEAPEGEITMEDGMWYALNADTGRFDREEGFLELRGDVNLFRDDGFEMFTEAANINLETNEAWGDRPVRAQGPTANLTAEGFRITDGGDRVIFTGESTLVLRPSAEYGDE